MLIYVVGQIKRQLRRRFPAQVSKGHVKSHKEEYGVIININDIVYLGPTNRGEKQI